MFVWSNLAFHMLREREREREKYEYVILFVYWRWCLCCNDFINPQYHLFLTVGGWHIFEMGYRKRGRDDVLRGGIRSSTKLTLNNRRVDHLEKCSVYLISNKVLVVADKINAAFNLIDVNWAVALDRPKVFRRIWHDDLFQIFGLIC